MIKYLNYQSQKADSDFSLNNLAFVIINSIFNIDCTKNSRMLIDDLLADITIA